MPTSAALLDRLADDLLRPLGDVPPGAPRTLLWLDPDRQFARLAAHLEQPLAQRNARLLAYAPDQGMGQVALKIAALRAEADRSRSTVIYLPGFGPSALQPAPSGSLPVLWSVYDQRYKGRLWSLDDHAEPGSLPEPPTLLAWLESRGVRFVSDGRKTLTAGGADAPLARYAERQHLTDPADWPRPLRLSDVQDLLGGDPRDNLRQILAAPANALRAWADERATALAGIAAVFGLKPTGSADDPEALADAFAIQLALAEAWDAFGRSNDFPFLSRLPAKGDQRNRLVSFARDDLLAHTTLGPLFRSRVAHQEAQYDLAAWSEGRGGTPGALPGLARARWQAFLKRLGDAYAARAARTLLASEQSTLATQASAPWAHLDRDAHWPVARDLAVLCTDAETAITEAAAIATLAGLVGAYAERWWHIDRLHLRIRAAARAAGLTLAARVADDAYFRYANAQAERTTALLEQQPIWPAPGLAAVETIRAALWRIDAHTRRALLVTDACRFDLAQTLAERLDGRANVQVSPVLSTLPSNTPFGMATLLPLDGVSVAVAWDGGKPTLTASGANLTTREGRKAFLLAALADPVTGKPRVAFLDLADLLNGAAVPSAPIVVVFDNDLDEQGHKGTEQLPGLAEAFVADWKRGIERLHDAGLNEVHVVTDHGFLLLPPEAVQNLGIPELPPTQTLYRHERWAALKTGAPTSQVVKVPLPLAPETTLGLPRGLRAFQKAEAYTHGGVSLQECVIPHLVSRRLLARQRVAVALSRRSSTLTGGTVTVTVSPVLPAEQAPLGALDPVAVALQVETAPSPAGSRVVAGPLSLDVKPDSPGERPDLFLREGLGLPAGQPLVLRALDVDSGRELARLDLTLAVDWD